MKKAMSQSLLTLILNGISILSLIFLVISLLSYRNVNNQLYSANEERFNLTYNANRFMNGSAYLTNEVRAFAATGLQEHYDNYWNEVDTLKNRDKGVAAMQEIGITSAEQKMIDDMYALSNQLVPLEDEAMKNVQGGNRSAALDYVYGTEYNASITQINTLKEQFLTTLDNRTSEQVNSLLLQSNQIRIRMILALTIVGIMQLSNMLLVRLKVLRPVMAVKKQMLEISQGNLSADFALQPDTSEIGMLVESIHETKHELKKYISDIDTTLSQMAQGNMNQMIGNDYRGEFLPIQRAMGQILDSFNSALSQINRTSGQVSEESDKMSSSAQNLADGATEQAAAVEEISKQVNSTSEDANHANQASEEAMKHLMLCNEKMAALSAAIDEITNSSRQIGGITKAIQDISLQTNILALNASVEAARAGEAGKGFAVVAGEVQSLANKSSESAKNISELIEKSIKQVQSGAALSVETMSALTQVITSGEQSAAMIERIASSATQQAESLEQVTEGMHQISDVVQTNASTAEDSAASAQELRRGAENLRVAVQKFQLRQR